MSGVLAGDGEGEGVAGVALGEGDGEGMSTDGLVSAAVAFKKRPEASNAAGLVAMMNDFTECFIIQKGRFTGEECRGFMNRRGKSANGAKSF